MTETRKLFYAAALIFLGLFLRMTYLAAPHIDADQAVFGLEGIHILKGEFPVFSWGYAYIGTLQSYMDAVVFYFFGPSREALNAVALPFYLLYAFSLYSLSTVLFRSFSLQLLTVALGAVAPDFFMIHGAWGRHGYPETFAFGSLLLAMVAKGVNKPLSAKFYFSLCFVAGLAWWSNFLIIYYFVPVFIFQLYQIFKRYDSFVKVTFSSFPGFFTGGLPFWLYNFQNQFESFAMFGSNGIKPAFSNALLSFLDSFSILIGAVHFDSGPLISCISTALSLLMGFMALFCLLYFGVKCLAGFFKRILDPVDFIWIFFASILLIFFTSQYSYVGDKTNLRYLVPFYSLYPLIPALTLQALGTRFRLSPVVIPLSFFLIAMNFVSLTQGSPFFNSEKRNKQHAQIQSQNDLFNELKKTGKNQFLMHEYWESMRYTFDSKEELIFADVNCRYPKYIHDMMKNNDLNYLISSNFLSFENSVEILGSQCKKSRVKGYTLYNGFENLIPEEMSVVPGNAFSLSTQAGPDLENALTDRVLKTAVFFPLKSRKHPFLDVRFSSPRSLMGLGGVFVDEFCSPEIIHVLDMRNHKPVTIIKNYFPGYRMGVLPFIPFSPKFFELYFTPVETDHLRFVFLPKKDSGILNWGLSEVFFLERTKDGEAGGKGEKAGMRGGEGESAAGGSTDADLIEWLKNNREKFDQITASPGAAFMGEVFPEKKLYVSVNKPVKISFSRPMTFIFEKSFLEYNRCILKNQGFKCKEFSGAEYSAVLVNASDWKEMEWLGKFLFKNFSIEKGEVYFQKALKTLDRSPQTAYETLHKALYFHPRHYYAFLLLLDTAKRLGKIEEYERYLKFYERVFEAQYPMKCMFANNMEFKGISIIRPESHQKPQNTIPAGIRMFKGSSFSLAYDYVFHEKVKNNFMVFVHFKDADGKVLFQNDHMIEHPLTRKSFTPGEMRRCFQQVEIPDNLRINSPLSVWLGIWDPERKKRFKAETQLEYKDRSIKIAEIIVD